MKEKLISNIHVLLAASIRIRHSYHRRSRGFVSEMKFKQKCERDSIDYLDGGWIFFRGDPLKEHKETAYVTTSFENPDKYKEFYTQLSKCPIVKKLFFLQVKPVSDWGFIDISNGGENNTLLRPLFDVYEFSEGKFNVSDEENIKNFFPEIKKPRFYRTDNKEKNYLDYLYEFSDEELAELYASRFIYDYFLKGRDVSYGMDFDGIIRENGKYYAAETKEKDPGPSNRENVPKSKWFFGWDTLRMLWYLYLLHTTGIDCYSIILEIDNQANRNPVAWKKCELIELCNSINYTSAISGGVGMGPTRGSTTIAPYSVFEEF